MNFLEEQKLQKKVLKYNHFLWGFLPAVILPLIVLVLVSGRENLTAFSFYEHLMRAYHNYMFVKMVILALIPNMLLFFFFYKTERWKSASGLIVATIFYVILMVLKV
jgi:hypothetical protein